MAIMVYYYKDAPPPEENLDEDYDAADDWKRAAQNELAPGYHAVVLMRSCKSMELIGLVPDEGIYKNLTARDIHDTYHYAMLTMGEENISGIDTMARNRLNIIAARRNMDPKFTL